jgi:hypothetical protein
MTASSTINVKPLPNKKRKRPTFAEFALAYGVEVIDDSPSPEFRRCRCTFDMGDARSGGYWFNGCSGYIMWREGDFCEKLCVVEFASSVSESNCPWDYFLPLSLI